MPPGAAAGWCWRGCARKARSPRRRSARRAPSALAVQPPPRVASARHGYAKELLRQEFRALHGGDNPPDWTVQTTFVPELQDAAEAAVRDGLKRLNIKGLEAALVAIDPATGNLLAVVGGSNYANTPFNRAVRSRRQPGSAFKPFVYAAALEHGLSPISMVTGLRGVAVEASDGVWMPRDQHAELPEALTLREALLESNNAAAVRLQQQIGARPVLKMASDAGVPNQPDVPSLALGSGSVSPLDLTAAYAVFPNMGYRVKPRGIVAVNSAQGDQIYYVHTERTRVLPETTAFQMVTMLQDVIGRGTGARVQTGVCPGRSAAKPARPTTTTTRGSSASRRRWWRGCGSVSTSPLRFATAPQARARHCRSGRTS